MGDGKAILSIGLIVKNEEKILARCLDSMKNLREKVASELIITDTGSQDDTVKIAKEYTEHVYAVPWKDDFSEARNFGLEKATGEWFLFIDADEWFEDTEEIEEFFTSGTYKNYDNASYTMRKYMSESDPKDYTEHFVYRMFKIEEGKRFEGKVKGQIPMKENHAFLNSYVKNYSYINRDEESRNEKSERNIKMLKESQKENPDDMRIKYMLAQEYLMAGRNEDFKAEISEGYGRLESAPDSPFYPYFLKYKALELEEKDVAGALEMIDKRLNRGGESQGWDLDLNATYAEVCYRAEKYLDAMERVDRYFKLYEEFKQGKFEDAALVAEGAPSFEGDGAAGSMMLLKLKAMIRMEDFNKLVENIQKLEWGLFSEQETSEALLMLLYACNLTKNVEAAKNLYENFKERGKKDVFLDICSGFAELVTAVIKERMAEAVSEEEHLDIIYVAERAMLIDDEDEGIESKIEVFELFGEICKRYLERKYETAEPSEEEVKNLKGDEIFIYRMAKSSMLLDEKKGKEALDYLLKAAEAKPYMETAIEKIMDYLGAKINRENFVKREFELYANIVKEKIEIIAKAGKRDEAIGVFDRYLKINPGDVEGIKKLRRLLDIDN